MPLVINQLIKARLLWSKVTTVAYLACRHPDMCFVVRVAATTMILFSTLSQRGIKKCKKCRTPAVLGWKKLVAENITGEGKHLERALPMWPCNNIGPSLTLMVNSFRHVLLGTRESQKKTQWGCECTVRAFWVHILKKKRTPSSSG